MAIILSSDVLLLQDKRAAWFNLFADLDPLADPDAVGRTVPGAEDRNCWMPVNPCQATTMRMFQGFLKFTWSREEVCMLYYTLCRALHIFHNWNIEYVIILVWRLFIFSFKSARRSSLSWNGSLFLLKLNSIIFTFHWYKSHCTLLVCFVCKFIFAQFLWSEMIRSSQKEEEESRILAVY